MYFFIFFLVNGRGKTPINDQLNSQGKKIAFTLAINATRIKVPTLSDRNTQYPLNLGNKINLHNNHIMQF